MKYFSGYTSLKSTCLDTEDISNCFGSSQHAPKDVHVCLNGVFFKVSNGQKSFSNAGINSLCYEDSTAVIIGDIFICNRTEIGELLELSASDLECIDDHLLLLRCYLKWGEDCLQHIIGEFSFAVWDKRNGALFCAVDHLGVKSFFYRLTAASKFLFSNKLHQIVACKTYQIQISKEYLIDYLLAVFPEKGRTVYSDIFRIPPGSYLLVDSGGVNCCQYWQPVVRDNGGCDNKSGYSQKLKKLIVEAVECRTEKGGKYGVLLSGGLDSSAVTYIAERVLRNKGHSLSAFSHVLPDDYNGVEKDERYFIEQIAKHAQVHVKYSTDTDGMSQKAFDSYFQSKYTLPFNPFLWTGDPLHKSVSLEDIDVLLTGYGGDDAASNHGAEYFAFLAKKGKWFELAKLLKKRASVGRISIWTLLKRSVVLPLIPSKLLLFYRKIKGISQPDTIDITFMKKGIVKDFQVRKRLKRSNKIAYVVSGNDPRSELAARLRGDVFRIFFEIDEYLFDRYSMQCRHPLMDKRIVEFILGVPPSEFVKDGWRRSLFRRSMEGVLPHKVQFRRGKLPFCRSAQSVQLFSSKEYVNKVLEKENSIAWDIIDREQLRAKFDSFLQNQDSISSPEAFAIGRCVTVASFLQWHDM